MSKHSTIGTMSIDVSPENAWNNTRTFGRLFPNLPQLQTGRDHMLEISRQGGIMDDGYADSLEGDNPAIPSGLLFLSQLMAHDITYDLDSTLDGSNDPKAVSNFRIHSLDLDSIYGAGPRASSYLYDVNDPDKLLLGINDANEPNDLLRNYQGAAIIGDPRDDTDLIVSQLHLAFIKFHNKIVDYLRSKGTPAAEVFREAQRLTRWHFQWIVIHEYLASHVGEELIAEILENGTKFYKPATMQFIPVEFAVGAFRYGHAQTRSSYQINDHVHKKLFDLPSFQPVTAENVVDWAYFFALDENKPPQPSRKIRAKYPGVLMDLPHSFGATPEMRSLALRDLLRGYTYSLPSGQDIAKEMGYRPLTCAEMGIDDYDGPISVAYYILKEAEKQTKGERLGQMGGLLVAEVIFGLIESDPQSYLYNDLDWRPTLPASTPDTFTMADMLRFAGVA